MLNLWRGVGERVRIETPTGEVIWLLVCDLQSHRVQIGVEADRAVRIDREERHLERVAGDRVN